MSTEERLSRLERQLRWLKRLGALAIAVGAVVVLVGQAKEKEPQDLVVRSLKVKDVAGRTRAHLSVSAGEPGLTLSDEAGRSRFFLTLMAGGKPNLSLWDESGRCRADLGLRLSDEPHLRFYDANKKNRVDFTAETLFPPRLEFYDKSGKVIWKAPGE